MYLIWAIIATVVGSLAIGYILGSEIELSLIGRFHSGEFMSETIIVFIIAGICARIFG